MSKDSDMPLRTCGCLLVACVTLIAGCIDNSKGDGPAVFPFDATQIVIGEEVTASFAAEELNDIVRKSTGHAFETSCGTGGRRIFVGRSSDADRILGSDFFDSLGAEESVVTMKDGDLFLIGGDELGVLWAVYDFCEDSLGYRWFLDRLEGGERIIHADSVKWNGVSTRRQPKFRGFRMMHPGVRKGFQTMRFRMRNRDGTAVSEYVKGFRHRFQRQVPGHSFWLFLPPHGKDTPLLKWAIPKDAHIPLDNFEKHPEWYSLMADGKRSDDHQLCLSNPDCRKALTASVLEWIRCKGRGLYMFGQNDCRTGHLCHCDGCLALEKKYNTYGGPLWDYILELCAAVKERYPEGVYISTLAYDGMMTTEKAPANIAKMPDNFVVDVAYVHCPDRPIHDLPDVVAPEGDTVNYWQNTLRWTSITDHASYWFYGTANPMMVSQRMQREIKELQKAGVESVGACGTGGGYEFSDMTPYLYYRLLCDPDMDVHKALMEMCEFKYGPAADDMLAYIDSLEDAGQRHIASTKARVFEADHPYWNMGFVKGAQLVEWRMLFDRAESKVKDSGFHAQNVRFAKIGLDLLSVLYADRIKKEAPDFLFDIESVKKSTEAVAREYWLSCRGTEDSMRDRRGCEVLKMLDQAADEMAYASELKTEAYPDELAGYQTQFITRILPWREKPFAGSSRKGVKESVVDPLSVCGHAIADEIPASRDISGGIPYYLYDWGGKEMTLQGRIPLSIFKKDGYSMYKAGVTTIPSDGSLIFAEMWDSPLAKRYLNRCHDPSNVGRKFEVWFSVRAEGPKFFAGDSRKDRLLIEQILVYELR